MKGRERGEGNLRMVGMFNFDFYSKIIRLRSGAPRISVRGGDILGGRPSSESGGGAPRTPESFSKI